MGCFRLLHKNYLDPNILADNPFSSEQTAFPLTNIYNFQRRSKVWRSNNGYWNVKSGENTIVFRETIAVDLTATVAVGTYTTQASFAAAVEAALEAAGASGYTVTQNSNLKFNIVSDGVGGGGIFELVWTDANSADMASYLGFSTDADDTGGLSYTADFLRIHAGGVNSEYITWDMGISTNPTTFCLFGERNNPIRISTDATIKLQGNHTNIWNSPVYEATIPYDSEAMILLSDTGLHTEGLRFWRLLLDDQNVLGYIEIGSLYLGEYFSGVRGAVNFGHRIKFGDRSANLFSEGGQTYNDVLEKTAIYEATWQFLTKEEIETITEIFDKFGISVPFPVSMDSDADFSTTAERRVKYVKFADEPDYTLISPNNFTCRMQFREEL